MYFNNVAPHWLIVTENCFQSCQFRHAPQPPDNPDLSLCDSFLFDDLKTRLKGEELESPEQLQDKVQK
jgi:hypothetical protein